MTGKTDSEKDNGDYLGYGVYADTLWNRVEAALNKDQGDPDKLGDDPLVVGIFGEWGAGKSKLLSLILERAQRKRDELITAHKRDDGFSLTVPVFFQPWKYEHEKHLLVPLLLHIEAELTRCLTLAESTSDKAKGKTVAVAEVVKAHVPAVVEGFKTLWGAARTAYQLVYGLPLNSKSLTDWGPWGEAPAVVYPASVVDSLMVRADMESASPHRHTLQAAGKLPEELSA